MNLRNKMRKFFTLSRRHEAGFTLVELIVVIAILAILGGVVVPVYSGYMKKANMQADMTLIKEIEDALTLAYYNGDLPEGSAGFIMLSPNEGESMDDGVGLTALAMEKAFGSNWMELMQLKYGDWEVKNMMVSYEDATAVVNSHFVQKYTPEDLMKQVQSMTDAVNGLQLEFGDTEIKLYDMYGYRDAEGNWHNAIDETIEEYGITKSWNEMNATERSNLLVLATASSVNKGHNSSVTTVMPDYALFTAFAAENAEFNKDYKTFQETINSVDPTNADDQYDQIKAAYNTLKSRANANGFQAWKEVNATQNTNAFNAIMSGVGNAMKDNGNAIINDLGNAEMFTTGVGSKLYNDYLDTAYTAAGGLDVDFGVGDVMSMAENGMVVIAYTVINGQIYIDNTLLTNG